MTRTLLLLCCVAGARAGFAQLPADLGRGDVVLDIEGDRVLLGRPGAVPPNADPALRLGLRYVVRGVTVAAPALGTWASQARLLSGGHALTTGEDGALRDVDLGLGRSVVLDVGVEGAVGASPDGRHLVYCKGDAPDLEVFALDRPNGAPRAVTRDMAPAWSPAVSPDGRRVVFASAQSGTPAMWRVDDGGAPRQIAAGGDIPDALGPTLYAGGVIVFEARGRVVVLSDEGQRLQTVPSASAPHWIVPGRTLGVVASRRIVRIELGGRP